MQRTFTVKALWDEEAKVFISESDIIGLHIEADTIEKFEEIMQDMAVEFIIQNHLSAPEIASKSIRDLVPAILWQRPEANVAFA